MPRSLDEIYAEITALPLAERLRLAARIVQEAARLSAALATQKGQAEARPETGAATPGVASRPAAPAPRPAPTPAAPRHLVVLDGSNFLGTTAGYNLASDASREELITRLQDFAHLHPSHRVVAYFDGQKGSVRRSGGVEVRFTPRQTGTQGLGGADFYIREALRALGADERRHAVLVTADRELAEAARKLGAKVEAPNSFNRRLPAARRTTVTERGLSPSEVEAWEEYFSQPPGHERKKK
jgi:hypothetical protein